MGQMESPELVKGCKTRVVEEAGCSSDLVDQDLPGNRSDVSNVSMVRKLRTATLGEGKGAEKDEQFARDKLPTSAGIDGEFVAKTLGMPRRRESRDETWYSGQANDVPCKLGHQDLR